MEYIISLFSKIDKNVMIIIAVIAIVLVIISFIKKAIKLAVVIVLAVAFLFVGKEFVSTVTEKVGITVDDSVLHVNNDIIQGFELDLNTVQNVIIKEGSSDENVKIDITLQSGSKTFEVPKQALWVIKPLLKKYDIDTVDMQD